jgi:hypothetical protein
MKKNEFVLDVQAWERDTKRYRPEICGAWLRLCIAAHTSEPRGIVRDTIAGMTAIMGTGKDSDTQTILGVLGERVAGKPSLADVVGELDMTYTITVRRMVKEEEKYRKCKDALKRTRTKIIELPAELQAVDEIVNKWAEWRNYRTKELRKPMPPTTQTGQIGKLVQEFRERGQASAIEMLQRSMDSGWTGIFTSEERGTRKAAACQKLTPIQQAEAAGSFFK